MAGLPERYFVDENMLSIAKALVAVRADIVHPGHPDHLDLPRRVADLDWLPIVGSRGWAVLMRDKKIRRRPAERQALLDHGVRAFCLSGAGNASSWAMLQLVVRHWHAMEKVLQEEDGPFIYAVTNGGLSHSRVA